MPTVWYYVYCAICRTLVAAADATQQDNRTFRCQDCQK